MVSLIDSDRDSVSTSSTRGARCSCRQSSTRRLPTPWPLPAVQSLPPGFVSEPTESPLTPPPHLTGGTVDLTLTLDGIPLSLGTSFDDFSLAARADSLEMSPSPARDLRRLLYHAMRAEGFVVLDCEWWHYEYGTRRWAALTGNEPLYGPASLDVRLSE